MAKFEENFLAFLDGDMQRVFEDNVNEKEKS